MTQGEGAPPELARAQMLIEVNRPDQALEALSRLPAGLADSRTAWELRTLAYTVMERWAEAADAAKRGLAHGPSPELLGMLGTALQGLDDYPGAERALLAGLAEAPGEVDLLCRYALLCVAVGQLDKAGRLVDAAAREAPEAPLVYVSRIDLAFARGQDKLAEKLSGELLGRYPQHPFALAMHGRSAAQRGRVGPAYRSFREAVAGDPTDADYANAATATRVSAHPLLWPLRPLYRLGVLRSWLLSVAVIFGLRALGYPALAGILALCWAAYCVYSWIAPWFVRKLR